MLVDFNGIKDILSVKKTSTINKYVLQGMPYKILGGQKMFSPELCLKWKQKEKKPKTIPYYNIIIKKVKQMIINTYNVNMYNTNVEKFKDLILSKLEKMIK